MAEAGDDRTEFEKLLEKCAAKGGDPRYAAMLRRAAELLVEQRRVLEAYVEWEAATAWMNSVPKVCGCKRCARAKAVLAKGRGQGEREADATQ